MFSVSERLEGPIESEREGDRYGGGLLISHAVDAVRVKMTGQENINVAGSLGPRQLMYYRYPSGEVSRQVYPGGAATVLREYTARGQLRSVSWAGGNASYTYLPDGKVEQEEYGNLLQTKYEYDVRGMIYSVRHRNQEVVLVERMGISVKEAARITKLVKSLQTRRQSPARN